jgi:hypothetical protein
MMTILLFPVSLKPLEDINITQLTLTRCLLPTPLLSSHPPPTLAAGGVMDAFVEVQTD